MDFLFCLFLFCIKIELHFKYKVVINILQSFFFNVKNNYFYGYFPLWTNFSYTIEIRHNALRIRKLIYLHSHQFHAGVGRCDRTAYNSILASASYDLTYQVLLECFTYLIYLNVPCFLGSSSSFNPITSHILCSQHFDLRVQTI